MTGTWTHWRAKVASLSRDRAHDDPELREARVNLRAARAALLLRDLLDGDPPLSDEAREALADLVRPALPVGASPAGESVPAPLERAA